MPEPGLADIFGVSRTTVRGALARLLSEGLVSRQANRSTIVTRPDLHHSAKIFAVRAKLEGLAVARISGRLLPRQIKGLREHVGRQRTARSRSEAIRLGAEFHLQLAACCGGGVLQRYIGELVAQSSLVLAADSDCGVSEHLAIVDALAAGHTEAAEQLMLRHVGSIAARVTQPPATLLPQDLARRLTPYVRSDIRPGRVGPAMA